MEPVKTRRQIAAEQTQRAIIETATRLFSADGYHATPIAKIASQSGVSIQTIYNSVGSKRTILSRVLDYAAAGERSPTPVPQFMREATEQQTDPRQIIAQIVEFWRGALPRTAPIFRIIREAATADPQVAALEKTRTAQRLANYNQAAQLLAQRHALRKELTTEQAAAAIFAIGHPDTYRALVLDGNWTTRRWANWAQTTLTSTLLEP
jgi:AcrR family transcriptional regulator